MVGTIVASRASNMTLLIISESSCFSFSDLWMDGLTTSPQRTIVRLLQGFGSAAVLSVGAGSLADMYEKHERGSKVSLMALSRGSSEIAIPRGIDRFVCSSRRWDYTTRYP